MTRLALSGRPPLVPGPRRLVRLAAALAAVATLAVTALTVGVPLGNAAMTSTAVARYSYDSPTTLVRLTGNAARRLSGPVPVLAVDSQGDPRSYVLFSAVGVAAKDAVDLTTPAARSHILEGEARPNGTFAGGHRPGTGFPGKSEFPSGWSDDRIIHEISMSRLTRRRLPSNRAGRTNLSPASPHAPPCCSATGGYSYHAGLPSSTIKVP